ISPAATFPRLTPGGVHRLPPLALIQTPNDITSFAWGDSLRTGPLSPALLNGPTHSSAALYDPSSLRTGLTPLAGNVSFPPPSPATAALFAMMTNNTPGTADPGLAGGGPRPHEGLNEGNHFEASFARAATDQTGSDMSSNRSSRDNTTTPLQQEYPSHLQSQPAAINPAHRSLLATQINGQIPRAIAPQGMHPSQLGNQLHSYLPTNRGPYGEPLHHQQVLAPHYPPHQQVHQHHLQQQHQQQQQQAYGGQNQNPLYLLSQAQDLSSHNDDAVVAAAALSNLSGPSYSSEPMNGGMLPSTVGGGQLGGPPPAPPMKPNVHPPPPPAKGKRGAAAAPPPPPPPAANKRKKAAQEEDRKPPPAKKGRRGKSAQQQDDELDDMDDPGEEGSMSPQPHNPNETEEEKRKNFLERNRQAALKCRQRKKAWLANLQSKVEILTGDNETLSSTVTNLKDEVASLRAILAAHASCPIAVANSERRGSQAYPNGSTSRF
ncbi:ATF/CREB family transcription factor, partial [Phenoliferia sp. Uapishka_3]